MMGLEGANELHAAAPTAECNGRNWFIFGLLLWNLKTFAAITRPTRTRTVMLTEGNAFWDVTPCIMVDCAVRGSTLLRNIFKFYQATQSHISEYSSIIINAV